MAKQTTDSFPEEREEIILDILKKQYDKKNKTMINN